MRLFYYVDDAWRNITRKKIRSIFSLVGLVVGSACVNVTINVGAAFKHQSELQTAKLQSDIWLIRPSATSTSSEAKIGIAELDGLSRAVPQIESYARLDASVHAIGDMGEGGAASIVNLTQSLDKVLRLNVGVGRRLTPLDENERTVVIGAVIASALREQRTGAFSIGDRINLNDGIYTVVGILESVNYSDALPFNPNASIFLSRTLMVSPDMPMLAKISKSANVLDFEVAVSRYWRSIGFGQPPTLEGPRQVLEILSNQWLILNKVLLTSSMMALLLGAASILNEMSISVRDRWPEIGVRLAVGAIPADIMFLFLAEVAILSLAGGAGGTILGTIASLVSEKILEVPLTFSAYAAPIGVVLCVSTGLVAGLVPAWRAAGLSPVRALQTT